MSDDLKQTIESYVATALKARLESSSRAVASLRDAVAEAVRSLDADLQAAAGSPLSLPDELFPPPAPPPSEAGLLRHIASSQEELLAATDQVGLLTQLILSSTVSCPRVAFFIVKKDVFVGWAARGFPGSQDADVRSLSIASSEDTILGASFRRGSPVREPGGRHGQDAAFLSRLGGGPPAESMAVPVWIRDKVAAILYGDSGQDEKITDPEVPVILGAYAGLCLETLATRQKYPRPKSPEAAAAAGPEAGAASRPAPAPPPPAAPRASAGAQPVGSAGTITGSTPASASLSGVFAQPAFAVPTPAAAPERAAAAPAPAGPSVSGPYPALDALPEEDRKLHEEARRFARLLVSEIVLYNERQVEEGRRNKDIYARLKEDIDRSLAMYEQRISPKVRQASNYFYQELVRTLANGDESAVKVPWA
jgi:hypothetical protein